MQKDYVLPVSILIAAVLIAGAVIYSTGLKGVNQEANLGGTVNPSPAPEGRVSLDLTSEDVILGDPNAPVTVIEYGDFQCPFCGKFYSQTESLIKENYVATGQVRFVYRHFAFLGPESTEAAKASECAKDQGKFWEYHDALFEEEIRDGREHNGNLNTTLFKSLASQLGLDVDSFSACLQSGKYAAKVKSDYLSAQTAGVRATPTTFVNGQKVEGAVPYSHFQGLIESLLSS